MTFPKPGKNPIFPQNRRPISLISGLDKLFERLILKRLGKIVTAKCLIPEQQFGFSKGCSATQQLLRLTEYIAQGFHLKPSTVAVFLDASKAYDTRWHTGFIYKLLKMEIPLDLVKLIQSFLAQRPFRVRMDGARSNWRPMLAGVPQGSMLARADSTLSYLIWSDRTGEHTSSHIVLSAAKR